MKIAMIVGKFPVISETFIVNQITGLLDRGHEVDIFPLDTDKGDTSTIHEDVRKYKLLKQTIYLPKIPKSKFLVFLKFLRVLMTHGFQDPKMTMKFLNIFEYSKNKGLIISAIHTLSLVGKKPYDIIHCQFGNLGLDFLDYRHIDQFKGKLITQFRGFDISRFIKQKGDHIYDPLFASGDHFFTNSDFFKNRVIQLGCDASKVSVLRSGLDSSRFPFSPRKFPTDGKVKILSIGRLVEKKGMEYCIKALAKLSKIKNNIELTIIGDGPLRGQLDNLIDTLQMRDKVKLLGLKNHKEIKTYLDQSHIFMALSVTAKDGNQDGPVNTLKEAMAMGLPVIGTQHGGIPELIEDGISGYLVPERDVEAIADKLNYLIENPQKWPEMGKAGRRYVEKHYDLNRLNDELVVNYEKALHMS